MRFAGPGPIFLDGPGQSAGTVGAVVNDSRVTEAAVIETSGDRQALTPVAAAQLADVATDRVISVRVNGLGEYRLVAGRTDGQPELVVTGLPLAGVNDTLTSAAWIIGGFSLAALALAVSAGIIVIRRELSPLNRMSLAAQHVAGLPLRGRGSAAGPSNPSIRWRPTPRSVGWVSPSTTWWTASPRL